MRPGARAHLAGVRGWGAGARVEVGAGAGKGHVVGKGSSRPGNVTCLGCKVYGSGFRSVRGVWGIRGVWVVWVVWVVWGVRGVSIQIDGWMDGLHWVGSPPLTAWPPPTCAVAPGPHLCVLSSAPARRPPGNPRQQRRQQHAQTASRMAVCVCVCGGGGQGWEAVAGAGWGGTPSSKNLQLQLQLQLPKSCM